MAKTRVTGRPRKKPTPKFYKKKFADGSYRVHVIGTPGTIWWRMFDPLPEKVNSGGDRFVLHFEYDTVEGELVSTPYYEKASG